MRLAHVSILLAYCWVLPRAWAKIQSILQPKNTFPDGRMVTCDISWQDHEKTYKFGTTEVNVKVKVKLVSRGTLGL